MDFKQIYILKNRTYLYILLQLMNLLKQNFITIKLSEEVLFKNFLHIEQQFKRIKHQVFTLKDNSKMIIERINEIDPDQSLQFIETHPKDVPLLLSNAINNSEAQREVSKIHENGEPQIYDSNTLIQASQNLDKIFFKEEKNSKDKRRREHQSRQSQVSLNRKTRRQQKNQKNSNENVLKQLVKTIEKRLEELEKQKTTDQQRIQSIQKDNERIKKILGFRNEKSKHKIKKEKKDEIYSINDLENLGQAKTKEQGKNNEEQKMDLIIEQSNFMTSLNKQFQELRQYVKSKMRSVDSGIQKLVEQMGFKKIELNEIKLKIHQNTCKLDRLQQLEKENMENLDKTRFKMLDQKSKSNTIYNKTKTSTSQAINLNDTVESYKNYYEDKIVEIFQQMDKIRAEYYNMVQKITNDGGEMGNDQQRLKNLALKISNIQNPNEQKLKKQLNSLRRDHKKLRQQFNLLIGDVNVGNNETRTLIIKPNENKQDWKDITQKIFKLRQELLSFVKELQNKINLNNDMTVVIQELEVAINECKIINGKKVNITDFEKYSKRIQNRLNNFIRQACEKEGSMNQQQALLAKQPWFCLSCDSQIKNYTGKIGKPVCNQRMMGKKVNPQLHMVRRSEQSKLPSVH